MKLNLKQQINLHQDILLDKPSLSFEKILIYWGLLVVIIFACVLFQFWSATNAQNALAQILAEQQEVNKQLFELSVKRKASNTQTKAHRTLAMLAKEVENNENIIQLLKKEKQIKQFPLSAYLDGFIITHQKGTYLSYIHASESQNYMVFQGVALEAPLVPKILSSWKSIPSLQDKQLNKMTIKLLIENQPWVRFDVQAK